MAIRRKRRPIFTRMRRGRRKPGSRAARMSALIVISAFTLLTALFISLVDKRLVPTVIRIEEYRISARINQAINESVASLLKEGDISLSSEDFYIAERSTDGKIISLAANTMLVNEICAYLSDSLLALLSRQVVDYVNVPIGALLGVEWLANIGPSYKIRVMPVGVAQVEYNTSFTSAGINQINFQVWLSVTATMQVVNPLQTREVDIERSVPLVNTVFAGEIPGIYFGPGGK